MIISTPPDTAAGDGTFRPLLSELRVPGGAEPVFAAPWEAQAFALAFELHRAGIFGWSEFAAALAEEIGAGDKEAASASDSDSDSASNGYYRAWLRACERLLVARGLVDDQRLLHHYHAEAEAAEHRRAEGLGHRHHHHHDDHEG